jgi:Flp pilus assembly protein TadB
MVEWMDDEKKKYQAEKALQEGKDITTSKPKSDKPDENLRLSFFSTYIYSVGYLAIALFINLWAGLEFKWFLFFCFGFVIFRLAWVAFWHWLFKKLAA